MLILLHIGLRNALMRFPIGPRALVVSLAVVCCSLCIAAPAVAQQDEPDSAAETVEPTDEQARLNDQGVRAISEEDYVKAISLLEEANYLGELNITYLNLGRAYQLAGRCKKAREALQKVPDAPRVEKPPAGLIESKASEYMSVLEDTCDIEKRSDGTGSDATGRDRTSTSSTRTTGIVMTSAGAALAASAVGMHFLWAEPIRRDATEGLSTDEVVTSTSQREFFEARDRANGIDTAALITGIAGGVVTGVGLYFWLSNDGTEAASRLQITPSTDGVRATWTLKF